MRLSSPLRSRGLPTFMLFAVFALIALSPGACTHASPDSLATQPTAVEADSSMAYCTAQDVIDAYSMEQIAEVTGDADGATYDQAQVQKAVDSYGSHIEVHVRMQHPDDPFTAEHGFLNNLNIEGAFLLLHKRTPGGMEENLQDAEERLDEILLQIAEGELSLLDAEDQAEAEGRPELNASELVRAAPRRFGHHRLHERSGSQHDGLC